jgi:hypothetical protein
VCFLGAFLFLKKSLAKLLPNFSLAKGRKEGRKEGRK